MQLLTPFSIGILRCDSVCTSFVDQNYGARVNSECVTVRHLRKFYSSAVPAGRLDVAALANSALGIISKINASAMTYADVKILHRMVDSIVEIGHGSLLSHLKEGKPDCQICAEILARIEQRRSV
jgi:hypothetical protein